MLPRGRGAEERNGSFPIARKKVSVAVHAIIRKRGMSQAINLQSRKSILCSWERQLVCITIGLSDPQDKRYRLRRCLLMSQPPRKMNRLGSGRNLELLHPNNPHFCPRSRFNRKLLNRCIHSSYLVLLPWLVLLPLNPTLHNYQYHYYPSPKAGQSTSATQPQLHYRLSA
jgi:hypothetical protein